MSIDLFDREQKIYDDAMKRAIEINCGAPFNPAEFEKLAGDYGKLLRQIRSFTKISDTSTTDLYTTKLELLDRVRYDALTGIFNRQFMEEGLKRIMKSLSRVKPPFGGMLSVLMIDIDRFKLYNDAYGSIMGDECLKAVAATIKNSAKRPDDFTARYGGEEFVVILPNTDENGARVMAERMLMNVRALEIAHERSDTANTVTVSIGGTSGNVLRTLTCEDYINQADKALNISKRNGRDQYTYLRLKEELK